MAFSSGLSPQLIASQAKSRRPSPCPQICVAITACKKGTMENGAQDTCKTGSIRQKRKQRWGGKVKRGLLYLSIKKSSNSPSFKFKNLCICYGLCAFTPTLAYVG